MRLNNYIRFDMNGYPLNSSFWIETTISGILNMLSEICPNYYSNLIEYNKDILLNESVNNELFCLDSSLRNFLINEFIDIYNLELNNKINILLVVCRFKSCYDNQTNFDNQEVPFFLDKCISYIDKNIIIKDSIPNDLLLAIKSSIIKKYNLFLNDFNYISGLKISCF